MAGKGKAHVVDVLRERIATHELPPGALLNEQRLADEFGVSRTVIRDALGNLAQRGLVTRTPNKGSVVARIEIGEAFQIYEVREVLEGLCARLAAINSTKGSWNDLVELFGAPMEELIERGDLEQFMANLETLRARLIESAGNAVLAEMLYSVRDKMYEIGRRIVILPGRAEQGLKEHRQLLQALASGDPELAERLRRENVRSSHAYLKRYQQFVL